ncbi:uncharacterized protein LOC116010750 [Ipomoea triloba]|uniref:uncharacterized protein LOC116010750 n=1 Tax=Ipomoea triloba TaxID=35885 RepID=UPI00125E52A3|nr:uncharacterized protein LOC116010750 [Ipomoea triloba]
MASYDNLMTMEPWASCSAFGDSAEIAVYSGGYMPGAAAAEGFPTEMVFSVAVLETTSVQTANAFGQTGSDGSCRETHNRFRWSYVFEIEGEFRRKGEKRSNCRWVEEEVISAMWLGKGRKRSAKLKNKRKA